MQGEVRFHHIAPEFWVMDARRCAHRWVVFHETYSFCLAETVPAPVEWQYRHQRYVVDSDHVIMAMQPGELHANIQRTPPADFIVVQVGDALMKRVAGEIGSPLRELNIKHRLAGETHPALVRALVRTRKALCTTLYDRRPGLGVCTCARSPDRHEENLAEIVSAFLSDYVENARSAPLPCRGAAVLGKATEYLRDNYSLPYSLDRVAEAARCGKYYLSHLFKQELGVSPSEYQNRILVSKSCQALARNPDLALNMIVHQTRWPGRQRSSSETDRVSLMIRHFRRTFGVTPGQFRAGLRAQA